MKLLMDIIEEIGLYLDELPSLLEIKNESKNGKNSLIYLINSRNIKNN
jgi:hypothetical protein